MASTHVRVVMRPKEGDAYARELPRHLKPRLNLDESINQARECVPCRQAKQAAPSPLRPPLDALAYVTTKRLVDDTAALTASLPHNIDAVVAIARSGLLPGSLVAFARHIPLFSVSRQRGVTDPGHGTRLDRERPPAKHVLLIDDTVANGTEMRANLPTVQAAFPGARITKAVIYSTPQNSHAVDTFVSVYPGGHYLEWNWSNSGWGCVTAFDFDGIICRDFTESEVETPESYRAAMESIESLFLPRRRPVPLVVTARPESTRGLTMEWLNRWGVTVEKLVMWPGEAPPRGPAREEVAEWKAKHYAGSDCILFAESDPYQAEAIAELSRKPVLCPAASRVFPGRA